MGKINLYTDVIHSNLTIKSSIKMATPQYSLLNRYTPPIAAKFTYKKALHKGVLKMIKCLISKRCEYRLSTIYVYDKHD